MNRGEALHQVRDLRAAAFEKAEAELWKRVKHATEHQIGDGDGILHRVPQRAQKAIAPRDVVPCHPPAANDWAGVNRMKNNRYSQLFRFSVKRPEFFAVEILLTHRRITNRTLQTQLEPASSNLSARQWGALKG